MPSEQKNLNTFKKSWKAEQLHNLFILQQLGAIVKHPKFTKNFFTNIDNSKKIMEAINQLIKKSKIGGKRRNILEKFRIVRYCLLELLYIL